MLDPGTAAFERAALRVVLPLLTRLSLTRKRLERGVNAEQLRPTPVRELCSRPGGRIDLAPPAFAAQVASEVVGDRPDDPGALTLVTCTRSRDFINGKTRIVGQAADGARLAMSPAEASARGFEDGERIVVRTSTGEMYAALQLDPALRRGVAYVFFGTEGLNRITEDAVRDPHSQIPAMANVRCSVRRAVEAHHEEA
jgi:anaerobic selenocysteine-containing dehydrogenase